MTVYILITASLLLYPIIGRLIFRFTRNFPKVRRDIVWILVVMCLLIFIFSSVHLITISPILNWILLTTIYLTVSVLLWLTQYQSNNFTKKTGAIFLFVTFGLGYLVAIFGFFFLLLLSVYLEPNENKWLDNNLIYQERNIGMGWDPDERLKEVEVYKQIKWFPLLAYRIQAKTYDTWSFPLQSNLDVSFSNEKQTLYLKSVVEGYKVFKWSDTIAFTQKHYR